MTWTSSRRHHKCRSLPVTCDVWPTVRLHRSMADEEATGTVSEANIRPLNPAQCYDNCQTVSEHTRTHMHGVEHRRSFEKKCLLFQTLTWRTQVTLISLASRSKKLFSLFLLSRTSSENTLIFFHYTFCNRRNIIIVSSGMINAFFPFSKCFALVFGGNFSCIRN